MCTVPHHGTPLDSPIARAIFTASRPFRSSSLLLWVSLVIDFFLLSILSFVALRDDTFSTDPFWLCSRLNSPSLWSRQSQQSPHDEAHTAEPIAVRPTHSQHSITNPSETDSLPATRPILPTVLSELLFQRSQNQGLPRLRDFVIAVFSHGYDYSYCPFLYRPPPAS